MKLLVHFGDGNGDLCQNGRHAPAVMDHGLCSGREILFRVEICSVSKPSVFFI